MLVAQGVTRVPINGPQGVLNESNLPTIGLIAAYFLNPREGLNFHGVIGARTIASEKFGDITNSDNLKGWSLMGGAGYDIWTGDQWSLGPEFRLAFFMAKHAASGAAEVVSLFVQTLSLAVKPKSNVRGAVAAMGIQPCRIQVTLD